MPTPPKLAFPSSGGKSGGSKDAAQSNKVAFPSVAAQQTKAGAMPFPSAGGSGGAIPFPSTGGGTGAAIPFPSAGATGGASTVPFPSSGGGTTLQFPSAGSSGTVPFPSAAQSRNQDAKSSDDGSQDPRLENPAEVYPPVVLTDEEQQLLNRHPDTKEMMTGYIHVCNYKKRSKDEDYEALRKAFAKKFLQFVVDANNQLEACITVILDPTTLANKRLSVMKRIADVAKNMSTQPMPFRFLQPKQLIKVLTLFLTSPSPFIRMTALSTTAVFARLDPAFAQAVMSVPVAWYIGRGFDIDKREREHAFNVVASAVFCVASAKRRESENEYSNSHFNYGPLKVYFALLHSHQSAQGLPTDRQAIHNFAVVNGILYRLMAMTQSSDLTTRMKSIGVLKECLYVSPERSTRCGLVVHLLQLSASPLVSTQEVELLVNCVVEVFDNPATRMYLNVGDIGVLFGPFAVAPYSNDDEESAHIAKLRRCKTALAVLFRSWAGLSWASSEVYGLRSLIDALHLPTNPRAKLVILDLINSSLVTAAPHRNLFLNGPWSAGQEAVEPISTKSVAQRITSMAEEELLTESMATSTQQTQAQEAYMWEKLEHEPTSTDFKHSEAVGYHPLDTFLIALLTVYSREGLPRGLMALLQSQTQAEGGNLMRCAAIILQQILALMDTCMSNKTTRQLHDTFDKMIQQLHERDPRPVVPISSNLFHYVVNSETAILQLDTIHHQISASIDDSKLQALLRDSGILQSEDYHKWNCESILMLAAGPLRTSAKLVQIVSTTKFLHRLVHFLKPADRGAFNTIPRNTEGRIYSTIASNLMESLLATREGALFLERSELPKQLSMLLNEVVYRKGKYFTAEKISKTLTCRYFNLIGIMSAHAYGIRILEKYDTFGAVKKICQMDAVPAPNMPGTQPHLTVPEPIEVVDQCLTWIHFGTVPNYGDMRENVLDILATALNHNRGFIRVGATKALQRMLYTNTSRNLISWGVKQLLSKLDDKSPEVTPLALRILEELCQAECNLDLLVNAEAVQALRTAASGCDTFNLLVKILGRRGGFSLLHKAGWVDEVMGSWEKWGCAKYAETVARLGDALTQQKIQQELTTSFSGAPRGHARTPSNDSMFSHTTSMQPQSARGSRQSEYQGHKGYSNAQSKPREVLPPHFLGELSRTSEGCAYLEASTLWPALIQELLGNASTPTNLASTVSLGMAPDVPEEKNHGEEDDLHLALSPVFPVSPEGQQFTDSGLLMSFCSTGNVSADDEEYTVWEAPEAAEEVEIGQQVDAILKASRPFKTPQEGASRSFDVPHTPVMCGLLWAIGHVGSSNYGMRLLEKDPQVLRIVLRTAIFASRPTLRGLGQCALSLIGRSPSGADLLKSTGFDVNSSIRAYTSSSGLTYSLCSVVPNNVEHHLRLPPTERDEIVQLQQDEQLYPAHLQIDTLPLTDRKNIKKIISLLERLIMPTRSARTAAAEELRKLVLNKSPLLTNDVGVCVAYHFANTYSMPVEDRIKISSAFDVTKVRNPGKLTLGH